MTRKSLSSQNRTLSLVNRLNNLSFKLTGIVEKMVADAKVLGATERQNRILEIINDPHRFTWIDIEGMQLIKEINKAIKEDK